MNGTPMRRRDFIAGLASTAATLPVGARTAAGDPRDRGKRLPARPAWSHLRTPHAEDVNTSSNDDNAVHNSKMADVRFGSKADIQECSINVRFTPESGHR
jgi:hypothetical protein